MVVQESHLLTNQPFSQILFPLNDWAMFAEEKWKQYLRICLTCMPIFFSSYRFYRARLQNFYPFITALCQGITRHLPLQATGVLRVTSFETTPPRDTGNKWSMNSWSQRTIPEEKHSCRQIKQLQGVVKAVVLKETKHVHLWRMAVDITPFMTDVKYDCTAWQNILLSLKFHIA